MERKRFIKKTIAIFVIAIIAAIVTSIVLRYDVEGESNMPFQVSKIILISTANGEENENKDIKWDLNLVQNSDIYIDIIKNKNYLKEEIIDKVIIGNINVKESPKKGEVKFYKPGKDTKGYQIKDELIYIGSEQSDLEKLEIANQGGLILLKCINENLGNYKVDEVKEIRHDGTLLSKIGIKSEEIKYKISFDISIELKSEKKYKTTVELEIPNGNLVENGTTNYELDGSNIIFKRF